MITQLRLPFAGGLSSECPTGMLIAIYVKLNSCYLSKPVVFLAYIPSSGIFYSVTKASNLRKTFYLCPCHLKRAFYSFIINFDVSVLIESYQHN